MKPLKSLKYSKFSFFLGLLCVPLFSPAQKDSSNKKIFFGLTVAPEIVLSSIQNSIYPKQEAKPAFGFAFGITGERSISKKFSLRGSLGYSLKKSRLLLNGLVLESDIDPITGNQISESKIESIFIQREVFAQISGVFYPINKKFFFTGGIELLNVLKSSSTETTIQGNGTKSKQEGNYENFINIAPSVSVGYNFYTKNRKILSIEPLFKTYLSNYGDIKLTEIKINTFALRTSLWF